MADEKLQPCVTPETLAAIKSATSPGLAHELLGCAWGRSIASPVEDSTPCEEPAARIIVLHPNGGEQGFAVKLCVHHIEVVNRLSTQHPESNGN